MLLFFSGKNRENIYDIYLLSKIIIIFYILYFPPLNRL